MDVKEPLPPLKFVALSAVVEGYLKGIPASRLLSTRVVEIWDNTVGELLASRTLPLSLKEGVFYVRVADPIWLSELTNSREQIRMKLNETIGEEAVHSIRFYQGSVLREKIKPITPEIPYNDCFSKEEFDSIILPAPVEISKEEISDDRLRGAFQKLNDAWLRREIIHQRHPETFEIKVALPKEESYDYAYTGSIFSDYGVDSDFLTLEDGISTFL